jgi:hypothetical protein
VVQLNRLIERPCDAGVDFVIVGGFAGPTRERSVRRPVSGMSMRRSVVLDPEGNRIEIIA